MARVNRDTVQLWLDSETTEIDPNKGHLLEIAWMCRTHTSEEGPGFKSSLVVPDHIINGFDPFTDFEDVKTNTPPFVHEMHTENGLFHDIEELIVSATGGDSVPLKPYSIFSLADQILEDVHRVCPNFSWEQGIMICGSSPNFDRTWLLEKLAGSHDLCRVISHQVLDVSSILINNAIANNGWDKDGKIIYPETSYDQEKPGIKHRALPDILQSYASWKAISGQGSWTSTEIPPGHGEDDRAQRK